MPAHTLVLGGTGQTGGHVVRGLQAHGVPVRIASRTPAGADQVHFDWADERTHDAALTDVDAVYLVAPAMVDDPERVMLPFLDRARARGVGRFVLLSSSAIDADEPGLGAVHAALRERGPGWTVLRPSWFMQNFLDTRHPLARGLAADDTMTTSTGHGRIGFIDVTDIAAVAVASLVAPADAALVLTGPAALSYDEAAAILSAASGRSIVHHAVSTAALREQWIAAGMPPPYADLLTDLERRIAAGAEDRTTDEVLHRTGRPPRSLEAFARDEFATAIR